MEAVSTTGSEVCQEVAALQSALAQLSTDGAAALPGITAKLEQQQALLSTYTVVSRPMHN